MAYTRSQVDEMLATDKRTSCNMIGLAQKIVDLENMAARSGRDLNASEKALRAEMRNELCDLRAQRLDAGLDAEPENLPVPRPLSLQGPRSTDDAVERAWNGPATDRTYRGMFYAGQKPALSDGGWKPGEFLNVLHSGLHDPRLVRAAMTEGTSSTGGFSVPEQQAAEWLDNSLPSEIIRSRATVWPMTSATRKVPGWDDFDQSSGAYFGGLAMQFLAEEAAGTYQTGKLRSIELNAKKGAIFCQMSNELVADGLGFEAQLQMALRGAMTMGFDNVFLNGTGAGQPLGIRNAGSLVSVAKESGQKAASLLYENFTKLWAAVWSPCRQRAFWIMNDDCIPQLMLCSIAIGTSGTHVPLLNESNGTYNIFGRPVLFSPAMPTCGSANDVLLVDLSQYAIGLRKDMSIDRSIHVGFQQDLDTWRILVRFDGMPTWSSAITPDNGSAQSWAAGLAARA